MRAIWAMRSALYVLFLALTVVPWALAVLVLSVFVRGNPVYWACAGWLRVAVYGARFICGVRWRVHGSSIWRTHRRRNGSPAGWTG